MISCMFRRQAGVVVLPFAPCTLPNCTTALLVDVGGVKVASPLVVDRKIVLPLSVLAKVDPNFTFYATL